MSATGPPRKKVRQNRVYASAGTSATHDRLDDNDFETVYARDAHVRARGLAKETPRSPQKGRTGWTATSWNLNVPDDVELGLDGEGFIPGDEDFGELGGDTPPVVSHKVPEMPQKGKKRHWVSSTSIFNLCTTDS